MRFDVMNAGGTLRDVQRFARDAAAAGFSGMIVTESGRSAFTTCTAAVLAADLDVLTGVAVAFARSPMVTAQCAWELADASAGRFRLGIGTQVRAHIERRYSAPFERPGPRLAEYVRALRAIYAAFRGDAQLSFEGEFYRFSLLPPIWSPGPIAVADPPVDVAAVNPWMLRMAGELADGVHIHPLNHRVYLEEVVGPELAAGAARAGRDPSTIQRIVPVFLAPGDTEGERAPWQELVRTQIAFYGSTPNYGFMFDLLGRDGTTTRIRERQKAGDIAGMAAVIDDDLLAHFCIAAPWDEMADRVIDRCAGLADRVAAYTAGMAWSRDPTSLGRWGEVARDVITRTS